MTTLKDANLSFNVTFEVISDDLAKASVNGVYVGRVKLAGEKIRFRCSHNPFTNTVPNCVTCGFTVAVLLDDPFVRRNLVPIVVRNFLYNFNNYAVDPDQTEFFNLPTGDDDHIQEAA